MGCRLWYCRAMIRPAIRRRAKTSMATDAVAVPFTVGPGIRLPGTLRGASETLSTTPSDREGMAGHSQSRVNDAELIREAQSIIGLGEAPTGMNHWTAATFLPWKTVTYQLRLSVSILRVKAPLSYLLNTSGGVHENHFIHHQGRYRKHWRSHQTKRKTAEKSARVRRE